MIDNLVMDETRVRTLKALAKSFARVNKDEKPIDREFWAADFVKGKGNGLVFLLHGRPGVGKTCTAGRFCPPDRDYGLYRYYHIMSVLTGGNVRMHCRVHEKPSHGVNKQRYWHQSRRRGEEANQELQNGKELGRCASD